MLIARNQKEGKTRQEESARRGRGSDMPDGTVTSCVARAFSALSFPAPAGGIVSVTYPVQFSLGDSAAPTSTAKSQAFQGHNLLK